VKRRSGTVRSPRSRRTRKTSWRTRGISGKPSEPSPTDQEAWLDYARQLLADAPEASRQLSGDPAEAAAAVLAHRDLFASLADHGVVSAEEEWTVQGVGEAPED
jgi:hypothetical protein